MFTSTPPSFFNAPLLHKISEFYQSFHQYLRLFPKSEKYSLGQKIENLILEILELTLSVIASPAKEDKKQSLRKISLKIDLLKILIRLANQIKTIDNKKYLRLEEALLEIGKMTGGWLRSLQ